MNKQIDSEKYDFNVELQLSYSKYGYIIDDIDAMGLENAFTVNCSLWVNRNIKSLFFVSNQIIMPLMMGRWSFFNEPLNEPYNEKKKHSLNDKSSVSSFITNYKMHNPQQIFRS